MSQVLTLFLNTGFTVFLNSLQSITLHKSTFSQYSFLVFFNKKTQAFFCFLNNNIINNLASSDFSLPFHDGGRCHIETSSLICRANQWTGLYMITASVMKGLRYLLGNIDLKIIALVKFFVTKFCVICSEKLDFQNSMRIQYSNKWLPMKSLQIFI